MSYIVLHFFYKFYTDKGFTNVSIVRLVYILKKLEAVHISSMYTVFTQHMILQFIASTPFYLCYEYYGSILWILKPKKKIFIKFLPN